MTAILPALPDIECQLPELRTKYEDATKAFIAALASPVEKAERVKAFEKYYEAGVAFFNGHERVIAVAAARNVDHNSTWYTDRAETAANLLQTILLHYTTLNAKAVELKLSTVGLMPSRTALANIERLVKETHPNIATEYRDKFVKAGLPTHGFDHEEVEKFISGKIEWRFFIIGLIFGMAALVLAFWGFALSEMKPHQYFILRWIFPLASGVAAGGFTGSLVTSGKRVIATLAVAATGGFAVWLITNFFLLKQ